MTFHHTNTGLRLDYHAGLVFISNNVLHLQTKGENHQPIDHDGLSLVRKRAAGVRYDGDPSIKEVGRQTAININYIPQPVKY